MEKKSIADSKWSLHFMFQLLCVLSDSLLSHHRYQCSYSDAGSDLLTTTTESAQILNNIFVVEKYSMYTYSTWELVLQRQLHVVGVSDHIYSESPIDTILTSCHEKHKTPICVGAVNRVVVLRTMAKNRSQKWKATWCKTFKHNTHLSTTIFHRWLVLFTYETHFTLHTACMQHPMQCLALNQKVEWKKYIYFFPHFFGPYIFYDYCYYYYEWLEVNYTTRQNGILLPLVFHFFFFFIFHFTARGISFNIVLMFTLAAKPPVMDVICVRLL